MLTADRRGKATFGFGLCAKNSGAEQSWCVGTLPPSVANRYQQERGGIGGIGGLVENGLRGFYKHNLRFSQDPTHRIHVSSSYTHIVSLTSLKNILASAVVDSSKNENISLIDINTKFSTRYCVATTSTSPYSCTVPTW